jgi:hypothetical protein
LLIGARTAARIFRGDAQVHDGDLLQVRPHIDRHAHWPAGSFFNREQALHVVQVRHLNTQPVPIGDDFRRTEGGDRIGDAIGHAFLAGIEKNQRFERLPLLLRDVRFEFDFIAHGSTECSIPERWRSIMTVPRVLVEAFRHSRMRLSPCTSSNKSSSVAMRRQQRYRSFDIGGSSGADLSGQRRRLLLEGHVRRAPRNLRGVRFLIRNSRAKAL